MCIICFWLVLPMLSEKTFKTIFNNAADGVLVVDVKSKRVFMANGIFCKMTDYEEKELKKMTIKELHREEDFPYVLEQFNRQFTEDLPIAKDIPFKRKDGSIFYTNITAIQIHYNDSSYIMGIFRDVSDRKQIKDELSFKNTLLETQLETTIDGILVVDNEGNTVLHNQRFIQMWNVPRNLIETKSDKQLLKYASSMLIEPEKFLNKVEHLYSNKEEKSKDELELKDGRVFDRYSSQMIDHSGNYLGRIWYFRDITEFKRTEKALKKSEETFHLLMEATNDALWDLNMVTNEVYRNPRHMTMLGYESGEFTTSQDEWETRIHPDDKASVIKELDDNYKGKTDIFEIEYRLRKKNGDYVWILGRGKVVKRDENGNPLRMIGTNIDITDRKRTEQALRESEEKYKALVENAGETIAVIDNNGVFLFMNTTAAKRLGGKPEDYIGKTMWDLFPEKVADLQTESIHNAIQSQEVVTEISPSFIQGKQRWFETTITPLKNTNDGVPAVMIIARDITDIRRTNEELNTYRHEMAHAERLASLGTLSATAAHELTQPLTVVRLLIENAMVKLQATTSPETVIGKLRESLTEISNITSVVDRFRNFARKSTEKSINEINVKTIANRIVNLLKESSLHSGVELIIRDLDELPDIYSNEKDIEQLFFALIDNAIHAAGNMKDRCIIISGTANNEYIELRFADNCGGIAPENLERIFEPFFTTKPPGQGTGLGLCIVQNIVARAGGKIRVESELGEGSTFFVTLPVNEDMK